MKCPICNENFENEMYEKKHICSNCGQKILLNSHEENRRIREKLRKELNEQKNKVPINNNETVHPKYHQVTNFNKEHSITVCSDKIEKKNPDDEIKASKKIFDKDVLSKKEPVKKTDTLDPIVSIINEPNISESINTENNEQKIIYLDENQPDEIINSNDSTNMSKCIKYNNVVNKIKSYLPKSLLSLFLHLEKQNEKRREKHQEKLEVPDMSFFFNTDGFYNDTKAVEPATADVISLKTILKILGVILSIILGTIALIYYM